MARIVSLRNSEGGELETSSEATSDDLLDQYSHGYDHGLLVVGADTYVWDERNGQWRLPSFIATGSII